MSPLNLPLFLLLFQTRSPYQKTLDLIQISPLLPTSPPTLIPLCHPLPPPNPDRPSSFTATNPTHLILSPILAQSSSFSPNHTSDPLPQSFSAAGAPPAPPPPRSQPSSSTLVPEPQAPLLHQPHHNPQNHPSPPLLDPPVRSSLSSRPPSVNTPHGSAPPHHQLSYAQVARGLRGPGFVRSHASDVEAFARLPRTGANIICGSREGLPSFSFAYSGLLKVEGLYSKALVMKFHGGRPSLESSHKEISSWGMENPFSIGPLTSRTFLLRFQDEKDLLKVLTRPSASLITFPYKVFRWHNLCHLKEDSYIAPVWISLPRLPLQCFILEFLESVANNIGCFLCLD